ncbi:Competence protein CoiA-like family protein [Xylanibacter ruminicola]|uniref:Competence protein CoiA-like family protein n=1 Tax=Xylanibacter ruminicola TaxID=839 RepID=A0A1M7DZ79_XYLRU|nr:competence protein CoiA family protein [Xylanibacter ruminicola]SFB98294.1 Competence protein CoiA-like family protein [Xylanibacter ruminicola]SHL84723.1 Competence protein CoiA-like family protein [Xylanibacter ruminicola]
MKFALVDNKKKEAEKGLKGLCPICQQPVIAKCGKYKINHWAHKSLKHCDSWWENETEWHRQWKNTFPVEWQEIVAIDENSGEKHIADIKTNGDMVVEFQHSNISEEERISRENFYRNMIWIVDGTRRKRDFSHFKEAFLYNSIWLASQNDPLYVLETDFSYLPKEWLNSRVPVLFDFKGLLDKNEKEYDRDSLREPLWCLLPGGGNNIKVLCKFNRKTLVELIQGGGIIFNYDVINNTINQAIQYRNLRRRYGYY